MGRPVALVALSVCAALTAQATGAVAASDPDREWVTLTTEHFAVHTYDDGIELARLVALYSEEARATMADLLGWTPAERVQVLVIDDGDAANGFATIMPFDRVTILAFPPEADSALGDYDDWLRLLVFHEYAHIAHLDNARGIPEAINAVLGKVLKPNQSVPRWFSEGLATWVETLVSQGGRVGASRFEMMLRAAALANRLPPLDALTGTPLQQPRGSSWYLYGSYLIDWIVRHTDPEAMKRYATAYGERLVPYALNIVSKQTTGRTLGDWYDGLTADIQRRAVETRAHLRSEGLVEGRRLTTGGELKLRPQFTPAGDLLLVEADGHRPGHLVRRTLVPGSEPEDILLCQGGCSGFALTLDGRDVVMSTARPYRQVNSYSDLRRFTLGARLDRQTGRMLTRGARARDPAMAADGRSVWAVVARWGDTWLERFDVVTGDGLGRWDPPGRARLDAPAPHPDGRRLFASMHHGGNRDLVEIDLATGGWRRLTAGSSIELDLHVTRDGRWLTYSSDATGIYNIYARDVSGQPDTDGRTFRLTHVVTGAFQPTVSWDSATLVYVGWTVDGHDLWTLPFRPEAGLPVPLPDPRSLRSAPRPMEAEVSGPTPYQPLPTMLPRSWMPTLLADSTGVGRVGLTLTGRDVTGRLGASVSAEWDVVRSDLTAAASFSVGLGYPDLAFSVGRYTWDRSSSFADDDHAYREEVFYGSVDASIHVPSVYIPVTLSASYTASLDRAARAAAVEHSPDSFEPFIPAEGFDASLTLSWSLSDTESAPLGVAPVDGTSASMSFRLKHPYIGSRRTIWTLRYRVRHYLSMPWADDHVLALGLRGGWSGGDEDRAETFGLGGPPSQDLLTSLINLTQVGSTWLRGFAPSAFSGTAFHHLTGEYRLPILRVRRGVDTLPIFVRDLAFAAFGDVGVIGEAPLSHEAWRDVHVGLGAELRVTTDILFSVPLRFRLGYAHGFGARGEDQVYLLMAPDP